MSLEIANNASELVDTNPTSTDLLKSADDHIRMIKRILKQGFQGHFTSLTLVRALTCPAGAWFTYDGDFYVVFDSPLTESLPTVIKLTNGKAAIRQAAYAEPKTALMPVSATQKRFPKVKQLTGTSFDTAAVNAAFGGTPIRGDIAIVVGTNFGDARLFTTSWESMDYTNFGHEAFAGTVAALCLATPLGIIDSLRVQRLELLSSTHLEIFAPDGVGPDSLRYWFGSNVDVVDGNGNIAYNSLSKSNAIEWKTTSSAGLNGGGTPVDGGLVVSNLGMDSSYRAEKEDLGTASENLRLSFGVNGTFSVLALGDVTNGSPVTGNYVATPSASTGSLYEIKFEKLSGDNLTGTLGSFMALSENRQVGLSAVKYNSGTITRTSVVRVSIQKIGQAGTLVTRDITLQAVATAYAEGGGEIIP